MKNIFESPYPFQQHADGSSVNKMLHMKKYFAGSLYCLMLLMNFPSVHGQQKVTGNLQNNLPGRYYDILEAGVRRIDSVFKAHPDPTLEVLERGQAIGHFPHAVLVPAVLYTRKYPGNDYYRQPNMLTLATGIGDLLVKENQSGNFTKRYDSDWDTYMWLEAYRLLENSLSPRQKNAWSEAIIENLRPLEVLLRKYRYHPWYTAPFIVTSPNHYSIYASALLVGGHVFKNADWIELANAVLHRFCVEEQSADGYWGEHSREGPTTGYDYVTLTQIALYWEYSKDPEALKSLRRSTDFHTRYTYPDGTPVETINDRNRWWGVSMWGHFGFSHFADGRRYAALLTSFLPLSGDTASYGGDFQSLARIAQNVLYFHEGRYASIPQDQRNFQHRMNIPAGIRKTGPWVTTYSGIMAPPVSINNFFLDRQAHFSVYHEKTGLIISGANSKRQPELATFTEVMAQDEVHMPVSTRLVISDSVDKLSLAYNVFFANILFPRATDHQLDVEVHHFYKWGEAETAMNIQLMLKSGAELETASGNRYRLGREPLQLDSEAIGGVLRHNGWTIKVPAGSVLRWPVFPFNPYKDGPETELSKAVGRLTIPLPPENQRLIFTIQAD